MTKTQAVGTIEAIQRRFRLFAKTCRETASGYKPRAKGAIDWAARAEVWDGAALELDQAIATIKARPAKRKAKVAKS